MRRLLPLLALAACSPPPPAPAAFPFTLAVGQTRTVQVNLDTAGEAMLAIAGSLSGASWRTDGAESITLAMIIDGKVLRHLVWATGSAEQTWWLAAGSLEAGVHSIKLEVSPALSRAVGGTVTLRVVALSPHPDQELARYAPIIMGRDGSAFTDAPLLLYGTRTKSGALRYTILYTNEDGGTGTDAVQLVARWGRLADIEWVIEVAHDAAGAITSTLFQGLGHTGLPFNGAREGSHAVVRVATANGTFADDTNPALFRFGLAPIAFDDSKEPRERLMDLNPWMHRVVEEEGEREGKLDPTCTNPARVWANRCYLYVDVAVASTGLPSERRVWGLEGITGVATARSEAGLGAPGRLDRDGQVRVAIPVGPDPVTRVNLYAVGDGGGPFSVSATDPRSWRVTNDGVVAALVNPAASATVGDSDGSASLLP